MPGQISMMCVMRKPCGCVRIPLCYMLCFKCLMDRAQRPKPPSPVARELHLANTLGALQKVSSYL